MEIIDLRDCEREREKEAIKRLIQEILDDFGVWDEPSENVDKIERGEQISSALSLPLWGDTEK